MLLSKYRIVLLLMAFFILLASQYMFNWAPVRKGRLYSGQKATMALHAGNESICSGRATERGPGQKVIAYSFYGPLTHSRGYFKGIEGNLKDMVKVYSGWVMRIYVDAKEGDVVWSILQNLQQFYPHLDVCSVRNLTIGNVIGRNQRTWRFFPLVDPLVEVLASRDLDSRFTSREVAAVAEWLSSNYSFHLMRDHPAHHEFILAGMWGARKDLEPDFVMKASTRLIESIIKKEKFGSDQNLLARDLWPVIKGHVMQHDSYFCKSDKFKRNGGMTPFPTKRLNISNNFVGCTVAVGTNLKSKCPMECRPTNHKDWDTC